MRKKNSGWIAAIAAAVAAATTTATAAATMAAAAELETEIQGCGESSAPSFLRRGRRDGELGKNIDEKRRIRRGINLHFF